MYVTSDLGEMIHVDSTLLFPIKNKYNKIVGLLEISNIYNDLFGYDEEYYGIVLSTACTSATERIIYSNILEL